MKKILILDTCIQCPYYSNRMSELDAGEIDESELDEFCHLSNKKNPHAIDSDYSIPEWCKLETKDSDRTSHNKRSMPCSHTFEQYTDVRVCTKCYKSEFGTH